MAVLALPALEAAATWAFRALLVAAGAKAADEVYKAAERRKEANEQAKAAPMAKAETKDSAQTRRKCDMCPPDCGQPSVRNTAGWSPVSIAYQARIGGMPVTPGFITEWMFNGVTFDGFVSGECLLKEAKARYDQFIDDDTGRPKKWWTKGANNLLLEAARQSAAASPSPPTKLNWYWMQPMSYAYFAPQLRVMFPKTTQIFQP